MISFLVKPASKVKGDIKIPFDKSITHRAIILASIGKGLTKIKNFSSSRDCFYTLRIFKRLGIKINRKKTLAQIQGKGLFGLRPPQTPLYAGESGTTIRILLGLLVGQKFKSKLQAAPSLNKRPMGRVIKPLELMGAEISAKCKAKNAKREYYPPLTIKPAELHGIKYKLEVASAQVKSAILLAGLYAKGKTGIIESQVCRDHTERMLKLFGADIKISAIGGKNKTGRLISLNQIKQLVSPGEIIIPGDFSSAIFFIVAALIIFGSEIIIRNVGLNPTRTGALKVLLRMNADIKIKNYRIESGEPIGDIVVVGGRHARPLRATRIKHQELPLLIDEIPILMVAACMACGTTIIEQAKELRVKETDRISSMVVNLRKMGANIEVKKDDTIIINGPVKLRGVKLKSFNDHRSAMSLVIAALAAQGCSRLDDISCVNKSFPEFKKLIKKVAF
ncbi:MAG: 3-phosphoshikimate 1-carboxyvinyltransferase [Candidatus Omnitrophota bacterium]